MLEDLWTNSYAAATYSVLGVLLMGVSFLVVDALTPGKLHEILWQHRSKNAAVLVASNLAAVGIIIAAAIIASQGRLGEGLLDTLVYSLIGIVIMSLTFLILDRLTPGKVGDLFGLPEVHPAMWVHGIMHVVVAVIIAVSIL